MAPKIEDYQFGKIKIDGNTFSNDVIITPDGVRPEWWRKDGHSLDPADLTPVLDEVSPKTFIMGRGYNDVLNVPESTKKWVEEKGIEFMSLPSRQAVEKYNQIKDSGDVMMGIHLTC